MKRELRDAWTKRLRNPRTHQIKGKLKEGYGFCCLGVLSDCAGLKFNEFGNALLDEKGRTDGYVPLHPLISNDHDLSRRIIDRLWNMNDLEGLSFPEIAKQIELIVPVDEG